MDTLAPASMNGLSDILASLRSGNRSIPALISDILSAWDWNARNFLALSRCRKSKPPTTEELEFQTTYRHQNATHNKMQAGYSISEMATKYFPTCCLMHQLGQDYYSFITDLAPDQSLLRSRCPTRLFCELNPSTIRGYRDCKPTPGGGASAPGAVHVGI